MPSPEEVVGENVRKIRLILNLTQEGLADKADLHRTYVGAIERGERNITIRVVFVLAAALNVDPRKLLASSEDFEYP